MNRYIKCLNKHSNDLKMNEDLPQVDLIVTEIFDDGLLGEGCLNTFYNILCVQNLLNCEKRLTSRIIPQSASIYLVPIECAYLRSSNYFQKEFQSNEKIIRINAQCLDNSFKFEKYFEQNLPLNYEPYTTENLNQIIFYFMK